MEISIYQDTETDTPKKHKEQVLNKKWQYVGEIESGREGKIFKGGATPQ